MSKVRDASHGLPGTCSFAIRFSKIMPTALASRTLNVPLSEAPQPTSRRVLFVLWLLLALAVIGVGGWVTYTQLADRSAERRRERHDLQLQTLASDLETDSSPYTDSARASIHLLQGNTLAFGQPTLGPAKVAVKKEIVPDLRFGTHGCANDFTIVDEVTRLMGGTATVFVKSGDRFIRVTTNIKTDSGARAIGTELDPKGPAAAAIRLGKEFTGVVDILGKSYFAIYEPIRNASGETLGIWYVGYPVLSASK